MESIRLLQAGGALSAQRGEMIFKKSWMKLACSKKFKLLQMDFIRDKNLKPTYLELNKYDFNFEGASRAIKEMIYSMAVQHGQFGTRNIFREALRNKDVKMLQDKDVVRAVYETRMNVNKWFRSSPQHIKKCYRKKTEK